MRVVALKKKKKTDLSPWTLRGENDDENICKVYI